jgi:Pyridoxamine 5'-phosphate oxidase
MSKADHGIDLWPTVPRLLEGNTYCVLATADAEGNPWATPVYFSPRDDRELFWVSSPDARHSRNIAVRSNVAVTVFDSGVPIGGAEALYLEARAALVDPRSHADALPVLNRRLPARQALTQDDLSPAGPMAVYRADVSRHFVLIRGGDPRFENVLDQRLQVSPPHSDGPQAFGSASRES